jgi:multimeric flavodoxin WrbA
MRPLVILGSARPDGETRKAVDIAFPAGSADLLILPDFIIGGYDYKHRNTADAFSSIAEAMTSLDRIVFATPVYWYAMSGPMKLFFDRLTDLTENLKSQGKALAGSGVWMIATGTEHALPEGFEVPFRRTSEYFAMTYRGAAYLYTGTDASLRASTAAALATFGKSVIGAR